MLSPASSASPDKIKHGLEALWSLGYDAVASEHAFGKHPPYFSGTTGERLDDLHRAFADPEIRAVICTRGGYGSNYLLDGLDLDLIRKHPKPFFAYSDMTAMQTWLLDQIGLVSFYGPMMAFTSKVSVLRSQRGWLRLGGSRDCASFVQAECAERCTAAASAF